MAKKLVFQLTKTVVVETDNVDDLDSLPVLSWFGFSGQMVLSLKRGDEELVAGTELGEDYAKATVLEVRTSGTVHLADGEIPAGRDWRRAPYNGLGG